MYSTSKQKHSDSVAELLKTNCTK